MEEPKNTEQNANPSQEPSVVPPAVEPQVVVSNVSKGSKKPLIIGLILLLLGGAIFAYWYMNRDESNSNSNTTTQEQTTTEPTNTARHVVYAQTDSEAGKSKLYWQKIGESQATLAKEFDGYVTDIGASHTKVYATVDEDVWYSSDEGKTYEKIYDSEDAENESSLGEQITSAVFASDGESLLIGTISEDNDYAAKKINLADKKAADLFESDKPLLLKAYSPQSNKAYYLKAQCWNCDGGFYNELYINDLTAKSESKWTNPNDEIYKLTINSSLSMALVVTGQTGEEGPGVGEPYGVYELELDTKKVTTIKENISGFIDSAYDTSDKGVYAIDGKLFTIGSDTPTYETSSIISEIVFVGDDEVIVETMPKDQSSYKISRFVKSTQESATLVKESPDFTRAAVTYLSGNEAE